MQGRIQTIGTGKQHVATGQPQEESDAPNPKRRPRPKKKQKGRWQGRGLCRECPVKVHDDNRLGVETGASVSSVLDPHQNMSQQSTASRRCSALDSSKSFPFPSPSFQEVSSSCVGSTRKVKGHRSQNGAPLKLSTLPLISEDDECSQCLHSDFRCDEVPSPSEIPKGSSCETPKLFNGFYFSCKSFAEAS